MFILFLGSTSPLAAQVSGFRLQQADSLYLDKKYTESLEHYQTILSQNEYTPAMLLKMAHIEERQGNIGQTLYYLNLYHLASDDKSVLGKMEELATRYNLEGYDVSDADQALSFYQDHHLDVTIALAVIALFFLALTYSVRRKGQQPIASAIGMGVVLIALLFHVNMGGKADLGIVGNSHTFLMAGPSPGAPLVEIVSEGHRVEIVGKNDVWIQVLWNGEKAFVKEGNLLPVGL